MNIDLNKKSELARIAVRNQDWNTVAAFANSILMEDASSDEGYFLIGLVEKASRRPNKAIQAFKRSIALNEKRYDSAIELASQYSVARENSEAYKILGEYEEALSNSPMYLDLAGTIYTEIGMPGKAWPLYNKANKLQPDIDLFQANLAACGVYLGKIDEARIIYNKLLKKFPMHQRNHYHLARLDKAKNLSHLNRMKKTLNESNLTDDKNIFMYFAIAKELEDLEKWSESFEYYKKGGDAVCSVAKYDISKDIELIDTIIEVCNHDWLLEKQSVQTPVSDKTPIFIVGLPRTGTTLTERIISSHSQVQSIGETQFLQMNLRKVSGIESVENMNSEMIEALAKMDMSVVAKGYIDSIAYRLGSEPFFIDKLPFNFLFVGFIAKAWPNAKIIHLGRNPMDACFAMFKQIFTWAYKFSYSLEDLGKYYVAYSRLRKHWEELLGDRLIDVKYEPLVSDTENKIRLLLERLELNFEDSCLNFNENTSPSTTASSVQVREKTHNRSIDKWKNYSEELEGLRKHLVDAGIEIK